MTGVLLTVGLGGLACASLAGVDVGALASVQREEHLNFALVVVDNSYLGLVFFQPPIRTMDGLFFEEPRDQRAYV